MEVVVDRGEDIRLQEAWGAYGITGEGTKVTRTTRLFLLDT
jgi:hypothetical protein